ncbi:MAG TPA: hypothetical protein VE172_05900 [Stackebrandtia sp.]|uniref:hypothetical protein n=1 Tax=Stackebrandtia sp. TaxID=2023065 RepID=UPI002D25DB74|nr:hypothetical protein [Stackebrandtia sp.]HZE38328.1 hypothetical protein [Stackebrandtia sp.]
MPPGVGVPGARPKSVTAAAALMVAIGILSTVAGGFLMWELFTLQPGMRSSWEAQRTVGIVIGFGFLLIGLGVIGLALAVLRGRQWARVITFVVYGFFICVGAVGLLLFATVFQEFTSSNTIKDTIGTSGAVTMLLVMIAGVVLLVLTVVLLALPGAKRFFR